MKPTDEMVEALQGEMQPSEAVVTKALHGELLAIERDHGGEGSSFEELSPEQIDMLQRLARAAITAMRAAALPGDYCGIVEVNDEDFPDPVAKEGKQR